MNKHLYTIIIIFLLFALSVSAQSANIILRSPGNNAVITTYTQDFIYSFDQYVDILNCSLIIDDEVKAVRNALIVRNNNKLTAELEAGTHDWYMQCYDSEFNEIISEARTLTVNIGMGIEEGYETVYNINGLRSYVLTITPGQSPVELPAMKGGEDIQIGIKGKTHYLDVIKMGAAEDTSFVEVRDRTANKIHRILVDETLSFDFDGDKTVDVDLTLKEVERNVNAYFIVSPYPGTTLQEPEEQEEEEPEPATESEPGEEPEVIEEEEPVEQEEEPESVEEEEPEAVEEEKKASFFGKVYNKISRLDKKLKWAVAFIVLIILLIVVLVILTMIRKKRKITTVKLGDEEKKPEKKQAKKEARKKPGKQEKIKSKEEAEFTEISEKEKVDWPVMDDKKEKFDIIKSTGRKPKK